MKNILILGAGQMGLGIAQVFATKGFKVELCDISEAQLEKSKSSIEKSLNKFASNGKISH